MSAVGIVWDSKERLKVIDGRLGSAGLMQAEANRLRLAREDVVSRMSAEELKEYAELKSGKTKEQIKEDQAAAEKEMEENRDKPSI